MLKTFLLIEGKKRYNPKDYENTIQATTKQPETLFDKICVFFKSSFSFSFLPAIVGFIIKNAVIKKIPRCLGGSIA